MTTKGGLELVYNGRTTAILRGRLDGYEGPVVVKQLHGPHPSVERVAALQREHEVTISVAGEGTIGCFGVDRVDGLPALIFRDGGGVSLAAHMAAGPLELPDALGLGARLARVLGRIHQLDVIHKDVNPANVVWNRETDQLELIDFGIGVQLCRETPSLESPAHLEGTLAYIAPEQTGRMNRCIDYRADLYSLGATLYELLSGRPPFPELTDPLEFVHAHIAREPEPLHEVAPHVPLTVGRIVARLLAKGAEDRYRSGLGCALDLERCVRQLRGDEPAGDFELGMRDPHQRLRIPEKLYGRDAEVAALFDAYQAAVDGAFELVLVAGYSGVGKTALVGEVHRPITASAGLFVSGKFDQFNRGTPYASLIQAFRSFARQLLAEPDDRVATWRDAILEGLAGDGSLLIEVVPELSLIVGTQPPVPELPPAEASNRFQIVFRRFVRSLATAQHPLVIFFDDLQWADLPTLTLLEALGRDRLAGHLLVIGSYRDNEVDSTHPMTLAFRRLRESGRTIQTIRLQPLTPADVLAITADALGTTAAEASPLAGLCYTKTHGNPFFLNQFLDALYTDGLLRFDAGGGGWRWDLDEIQARDITDNVVDFMARRIAGLDPGIRRVLSKAAFLGNGFEIRPLCQLLSTDPGVVRAHLRGAVAEDLVMAVDPAAGRYRFAHDRVQQAAYALTDSSDRPDVHLAAGRIALQRYDAGDDDVSLYDVVNQLAAGAGRIEDAGERSRLCELNLAAGLRALAAAAYEPAWAYLRVALDALSPQAWSTDYARALEVHLAAARAAYLSRHDAEVDSLVDRILESATGELDKAAAHEVAMDAMYAQGELAGTIDRGLSVLRLLGVELPNDPGEAEVVAGLMATQKVLEGLDRAAILARAPMQDPKAREAARILHALASPSYFARGMLVPLIAFELVQSAVRNGLSVESQFGFAVQGLFLCTIGDIAGGVEAGHIAMALAARSDAPQVSNVVKHVYNTHIRFWHEPWTAPREPLREVFRDGHDLGDFLFGCFGAHMTGAFGLFSGEPLGPLLDECLVYQDRIAQLDQSIPLRLQKINVQLVHNLHHGPGKSDDELSGAYWDGPAMCDEMLAQGDATNLYVHLVSEAFQCVIFGRWAEAARATEQNLAYLAAAASSVFVPNYFYLDALAHLQILGELDDEARARALARIDETIAKLESWTGFCEANHRHRLTLLHAERVRAMGQNTSDLHDLYATAIADARDSGRLYDQALASELAASWYVSRGNDVVGRAYLVEARHHYERWGCSHKVWLLDEAHARLLGRSGSARTVSGATISATTTGSVEIDALAVIRASRAISQEIKLDRLVERLLETSIASSGARKGVLLLVKPTGLVVQAEGVVDAGLVVRQVGTSLAEYGACPSGLLRYVQRTAQAVVLADAGSQGLFTDEPYIRAGGIKSVLCLPLEQQGQLNAILYLENDRTTDTFTEDRVEPLQLIGAQAAISIENATLVDNLEDLVVERTRALVVARERSEQLLLNVLPRSIAGELKEKGHTDPIHFESATVLFTDFKGFTRIAELMSARELVGQLDTCFSAFDAIATDHRLEKLKTIGDAYMCVGGIPNANRTHPVDAILAGLAFQSFMARLRDERAARGEDSWELRLGIHTGPLVAGVIGTSKFAYDVWGDTVNTASRMESSGATGKVNVSAATWRWAEPLFEGTFRGEIAAKNKGTIPMYFVERIRAEYSADAAGTLPNADFAAARARVEAERSV